MLNFRPSPDACLIERLNALLLPHDVAPAHIAKRIMRWLEADELSPAITGFELVKSFDALAPGLYRHAYRDLLERSYLQLEADTRLDAEYAVLRRFASLHTLQARNLLTEEEETHVTNVLDAVRNKVFDYPWGGPKQPMLSITMRVVEQHGGAQPPLWVPRPTVHQADMTVRH